jgi:hypothetical protein
LGKDAVIVQGFTVAVGLVIQVDALLSQSQAEHGVIKQKVRVIDVPVRLQSQPFLKDDGLALARVLIGSLLVRTLFGNQLHFTVDSFMLDKGPLFAADVDTASGDEKKTEDRG